MKWSKFYWDLEQFITCQDEMSNPILIKKKLTKTFNELQSESEFQDLNKKYGIVKDLSSKE
jgi:hypothetical protein